MNLGKIIKGKRAEYGMSQRVLGEKVGMPNSQIANYENGKTGLKDKKAIEMLVKGFDIPYSKAKMMIVEFKLRELASDLSAENKIKMAQIFNKSLFGVKNIDFLHDDKNWIPVYESIADGYSVNPPEANDQYPIPRTFSKYSQEQLFYAKANDDSMSPKIDQNDEILITREDFTLEDGKIYIFKENNAYIIRKYKKITDDIAQLVPENKNYPDITITKDKQIECVGQVIRVQKRFV